MRRKALTWNVNESSNSGGRIDAQLEFIGQLAPDLVMLQAVRWEKWLPVWLVGLEELGFDYVQHTRGWAETLKQSRVWPRRRTCSRGSSAGGFRMRSRPPMARA